MSSLFYTIPAAAGGALAMDLLINGEAMEDTASDISSHIKNEHNLNNQRDTLDHAVGSAMLTDRYGSLAAEAIYTGFEVGQGVYGTEAGFKDLWNDAVGRQIMEYCQANDIEFGSQEFRDLVADAYERGDFMDYEDDDDVSEDPRYPSGEPNYPGPSETPPPSGDGGGGNIPGAGGNIPGDGADGAPGFSPGAGFLPAFLYPYISPLIIDLDKDAAIDLTAYSEENLSFFDMDADGFAEQTGWTDPAGGDAFLAIDTNDNGVIDDITELFGDSDTDGFVVLAALDSNEDDVIDENDADFADLLVWQDADGDGFSDEGELQTLTEANITEIDLTYSVIGGTNEGHEVSTRSTVTFGDSSTAKIEDIWFEHSQANSFYIVPEEFEYDADVFVLPQLRGSGVVADLWVAMTDDATLKGLVEDLAEADYSSFSFASFSADVEDILFRWLGVDGVNPTSRGAYIDARALEGIEAWIDRGFVQPGLGGSDPWENAGGQLSRLWDNFVADIASRFMVQIPTLPLAQAMQDAIAALEEEEAPEELTEEELGELLDPIFAAAETAVSSHPLADYSYQVSYDYVSNRFVGEFIDLVDAIDSNEPGSEKQAYWLDLLPVINAVADSLEVEDADYITALTGTYLDTITTAALDTLRTDKALIGTSGNDSLDGVNTDDYLVGGLGDDTLAGGDGLDYYSYFEGDGNDLVIDDRETPSGPFNRILIGPGIDEGDVSYANVSDDLVLTLAGGGSITIQNQLLNEYDCVEEVQFDNGTIYTGYQMRQLVLDAEATSGNDTVDGFVSPDTLEGGAGDDVLNGNQRDDVYIYNSGDGNDTIDEYPGEGNVLRFVSVSQSNITLSSVGGGQDLVLSIAGGGSVNIDGQFSGSPEMAFFDFTGGDLFSAAAMSYFLSHGATIAGAGATSGNDSLTGTAGVDFINGRDGDDTLSGSGDNDELNGWLGNDSLVGGAGNDTMIGGLGDDVFVFADASDVVTENSGEGTDLLQSSIACTLGSHLENLTLTGSSNINGTGNTLNNSITGNDGNNSLSGGDGNDTLTGGLGNDTLAGGNSNDVYVVEQTGDVVSETGNGTDTIQAGVSYTIAPNIEYMILTGSSNINGTGSSSANTITGNDGNNSLTGADGNDSLTGGSGADTLDGGNNNDTLTGGSGDDSMVGGSGNDRFIVEQTGDVVSEGSSGGTDTVESAISYTLTSNVEKLTLTGTGNIDGTGNSLNNFITGNAGNNVLSDGGGNDTIIGGAGNDTFIITSTSASIDEESGGGTDEVQASVNHGLDSNVENLVLTGSSNINGSGSDDANSITGNSGNNNISGNGGDDTLFGGLGTDTINGNAGADIFLYTNVNQSQVGSSRDQITFTSGTDKMDLSAIITGITVIGSSAFSGTGGPELRVFVSGSNTLLDLDVDGNATADFEIKISSNFVQGDLLYN